MGAGEHEKAAPAPLFTSIAYKWLEIALDYGIAEHEYWDMTIAELMRAIESKKRQLKAQAQEKATFDYALADLIGRSVARIYSSSNKMPSIAEAYPTLFDAEEIKEKQQAQKDTLSIMRLKQFAQNHNNRIKGGAKD